MNLKYTRLNNTLCIKNPFKTVKALTAQICAVGCAINERCTGFSYAKEADSCEMAADGILEVCNDGRITYGK